MSNFEPIWKRVDEDDPRRCQHIIPTAGQCRNQQVEGSEYCPAHGGNRAYQTQEKKNLRNYRLTQFKQQISELGNSDQIISLQDEIGILRMMIQEKINRCTGMNDLLLMSGSLADLTMKVEKLVVSCNRLDIKLGNFLDRGKVLQFAQTIVQIIANYIDEDDKLEAISAEILTALDDI